MASVVPDTAFPRWFIVVRRDKRVLHQHLSEQYEGDARVEVIFDRRSTTVSRMPIEANLRRAERRMLDRRAAAQADRRQTQRRRPLALSQHAFWVTEGFFMVRRTLDRPTA
jgi:hypothetical protein